MSLVRFMWRLPRVFVIIVAGACLDHAVSSDRTDSVSAFLI
jgi:ABC-type enterobactin transport system permease subunit